MMIEIIWTKEGLYIKRYIPDEWLKEEEIEK